MRIVQVLSPAATLYEQKCQRVDFEGLRTEHDVTVVTHAGRRLPLAGVDIAHFYGPKPQIMRPSKRWFAKTVEILAPEIPEAVEEKYWRPARDERRAASVGCVTRRSLANLIAQTAARVHRTRDDIEFLLFDAPPTPEEFASIGVWVDPAIEDDDFDGYVAEALVSGVAVAASRTPMNVQRLEKGRTGFLVPPNDPNELTHAILSALFKPEVTQQKLDAARQTIAKFRARQRLRILTKLYESLHR